VSRESFPVFGSEIVKLIQHDHTEPIYSVLTDARTSDWPTETFAYEMSHHARERILHVRFPLMQIVLCVDLSSPKDVDLVGTLLYSPTPSDVFIQPIHIDGSPANNVLTKCYDTISRDSNGVMDLGRIRDFFDSLSDLAGLPPGKPISERAAILVCQMYTQRFDEITDWISTSPREVFVPPIQKLFSLEASTLVINDEVFPVETIQDVLSALVYGQSKFLSSRRDEL
jgi:hypothetical protein